MKTFLLCILLFFSSLFSEPSELKLMTLYHSLDHVSIAELFAFYHLYPESRQGKQALDKAWNLMNSHRKEKCLLEDLLILPPMELQGMISFVNKESYEPAITLTDEQLTLIENVASHLHNRSLKGFSTWQRQELLSLPSEEIDLARALLLHEFEESTDASFQIRQYEASLDLMALQILARLNPDATDEEKIAAINHFIFHEKRFRFPPHSLWAKDIDLYTFLPSVLDNRLGVCLGVSILYLSIAQRLNLPLEIITPPGHIYLRYQNINIETTARGVSPPSKTYLGINTRKLQTRTLKEVVGLAFINKASVSWHQGDYETTTKLYEKALPYLTDDLLLKMLLGYNYLFIGEKKKGIQLLKEIQNQPFDFAVSFETTPDDLLRGHIDAEGIQAIFLPVDETRASILEKQKKLKGILAKYPKFRDGLFHLAITQLQLSETSEAFKTLTCYHKIDPTNPIVEYYLSIICINRLAYQKAWTHLKKAELLTQKRSHYPEALKCLRHHLRILYPDPEAPIPTL